MRFLRFFKNFYNLYVAFVVLLLITIAPFIGYTFKRNYSCKNLLYFLIIILLVSVILFLIWNIINKNLKFLTYIKTDKGFRNFIICTNCILLIVEILICFGGWFVAGWDTRNVILSDMQIDNDYMSMYPNQIFLAGVFRTIHSILENFGYTSFDTYYIILVLISALACNLTVLFIAFTSKRLSNSTCAIITYLFSCVFIGISPWIMIPYSDNFAMLCTIFVLFINISIKKPYLKWPLMIFVSLIGYSIKPTAIFILFAIVFYEIIVVLYKLYVSKKKFTVDIYGYRIQSKITLLEKLSNKISKSQIYPIIKTKPAYTLINKPNIIKAFLTIGLSITCVLAANLIIDKTCDYGLNIDENSSFTPTHFLMMGINWENLGAWNLDDVNISRSYYNIEERQTGNILEWKNRLAKYGPINISWILLNKTMTNYGDGAFAWEAETPWCMENKGNNPVVWFFYGLDPWYKHNDNNNFFAYIWQVLWLMILMGNIAMILNQRPKKHEIIMCITMLEISAFLTIFEPDPRYILLYMPYLVIMGIWGYKRIYNFDNLDVLFKNIITKTSKRKQSKGKGANQAFVQQDI